MIIQNIDSLRSWLISKLTPMCDADPHALAKYVIALVKKDKPVDELKQECTNQLDVFLQKETQPFVTKLFEVLNTDSYNASNNDTEDSSQRDDRDKPKDGPRKRIARSRSPVRHRSRSRSRSRSPYSSRRPPQHRYDSRRRSPVPYSRRNRKINSRSNSPRRSSPSWRRSPRRGSPRRPRRRSWSRSRSRSRSRSPRSVGGSSHSRSPEPKSRSSDDSAKKKIRCWDYDQKGFCVQGDSCPYDHGSNPLVVDETTLKSSTVVSNAPTTTMPVINPSGPAPRPPVLPPPPGVPVPPPPPHPPVPPFMLHPPPILPPGVMPRMPQQVNIPPPRMPSLPPVTRGPPPPPGYNPEAPALNYKPRHQNLTNLVPISADGTKPLEAFNPIYQGKRVVQMEPDGSEPKIKRPMYQPNSYTSSNTGNPGYNPLNTKLVVKKIPPALNNITKLNEHFSKFGAINNIQVKFEGDPGNAMIEYAHVNSAREAKRDTGAILNNRFIQVFWWTPNLSQNNVHNANAAHRLSVKERLGPVALPSQLKYTAPGVDIRVPKNKQVTLNAGSLSRTVTNHAVVKAEDSPQKQAIDAAAIAAANAKKLEEEKVAKKRILIAQQATKQKQLNRQNMVIQKKVQLQKQRQSLMNKQIQQQKLLLKKVDTNKNMLPSEKSDILQTLKTLSSSISALQKSLQSTGDTVNPSIVKQKKVSTQKELLDAELDLYNASSAGEDTISLKRKLNQLQVEAQSLGIVKGWAGRGRGRGGHFRGHHRSQQPRAFHSSANLDRRPRELRVTGFHLDEKDEILSHFAEFGDIENFTFGDDGITCTMKYKLRSQAENAIIQGATFKNRKLIIIWQKEAQPEPIVSPTQEKVIPSPIRPPDETLIVPENENGNGGEVENNDEDVAEENEEPLEVPADDEDEEEEVIEDAYGEEDVYGQEGDEIDEDALLAGDYDEDEELETRTWRH